MNKKNALPTIKECLEDLNNKRYILDLAKQWTGLAIHEISIISYEKKDNNFFALIEYPDGTRKNINDLD